MAAVKMGFFGEKTRTTHEWHPHKNLAKFFNGIQITFGSVRCASCLKGFSGESIKSPTIERPLCISVPHPYPGSHTIGCPHLQKSEKTKQTLLNLGLPNTEADMMFREERRQQMGEREGERSRDRGGHRGRGTDSDRKVKVSTEQGRITVKNAMLFEIYNCFLFRKSL